MIKHLNLLMDDSIPGKRNGSIRLWKDVTALYFTYIWYCIVIINKVIVRMMENGMGSPLDVHFPIMLSGNRIQEIYPPYRIVTKASGKKMRKSGWFHWRSSIYI